MIRPAPVDELSLRVREYENLSRWSWVLVDGGERVVAAHRVRLDTAAWQFEAFLNLYDYVRWRAAPDRWLESQREIIDQVGRWIGTELLGDIGNALVARRPVAVRVIVPEKARLIAHCPLELAQVRGKPLALHRVTLLTHTGDEHPPPPRTTTTGRLRVLGLFSLPVGSAALNLRKERFELAGRLRLIARTHRRAVELRAVQYGVTEQRLRGIIDEGEGWDVLHIAGHGEQGGFLLEHPDGTPRQVTGDELANWLEPLAGRVKLAIVSACSSAALTASEQLSLLGFTPVVAPRPPEQVGGKETYRPALAMELGKRLGCAVLGMRYPVTDEFAMALTGALYDRLIGRGQPLPAALGLALAELMASPAAPTYPPLSVATPTLFGAVAATMTLSAPAGEAADLVADDRRLANYQPQPERFVGRVDVMAAASQVLAPESGRSGLVLHGMAGAGKTACAAELGYTHNDTFDALVWYQAPGQDDDISGALTEFAVRLDSNISGCQLVHLVDDEARLCTYLPHLTESISRCRVLIVLDNAESLLTDDGNWRDTRWRHVINALTAHNGVCRLIITSRLRPLNMGSGVHVAAVHALSRDETVLLARELPNLRALMDGTTALGEQAGRALAVRILAAAQGHPTLLELADTLVADPSHLANLAATADAIWSAGGYRPADFFTTSNMSARLADYQRVLRAWTTSIVETLTSDARDLFHFLCCLEPVDRTRSVLEHVSPAVQEKRARPVEQGAVDTNLAALSAHALIKDRHHAERPCDIHPEIAAAGRAGGGADLQAAVDKAAAAYWVEQHSAALDQESRQGTGRRVVRTALHAMPYLMRTHQWRTARQVVASALARDHSRTTVSRTLPVQRRILAASVGSAEEIEAHGGLARALKDIDPAKAEHHVREALTLSLRRNLHRNAAAAARDLIDFALARENGAEALRIADDVLDHMRKARLGPWTQLALETERVRVLLRSGRMAEALPEFRRLRDVYDHLPEFGGQPEAIRTWDAREQLFRVGMIIAMFAHQWHEALEQHTKLIASMRARGAMPVELATAQAGIAGVLRELDRMPEAHQLLRDCQATFERAGDLRQLAGVVAQLADLEFSRGHTAVAVDLQRDALRYGYAINDLGSTSIAHHELGRLLAYTSRFADAIAHSMAAALLWTLTNQVFGTRIAINQAREIWQRTELGALPANVDELAQIVDAVPGVHLDRLLTALGPPPETLSQVWATVTAEVQTADPTATIVVLARWEPVVAALLAAERGDARAAAAIDDFLAETNDSSPTVVEVGRVLRQIRRGSRDDLRLVDIPDSSLKRFVEHALDVLAGRATVPVELWPAIGLGPLLGELVESASGDATSAAWVDHMLAEVAQHEPDLVRVLRKIHAGDYDESLVRELNHPTDRAIVATVLKYMGQLPR